MTYTATPACSSKELDRIERAFWAFHQANPLVYEKLRDLALNLRRKGIDHYGIKALFEVVRFHHALSTNDPDYKLNNNFTSLYSRLLMDNETELQGFFRTRERIPSALLHR
jgi:hypothetical protein